jgi:hypothetical protein
MTKRLNFSKAHNLGQLHDEILAAFPALAPTPDGAGQRVAIMGVEGLGDGLWLTVPDGTDEVALAAVVAAHVARSESPPTDWQALYAAAASADARLDVVARRLDLV